MRRVPPGLALEQKARGGVRIYVNRKRCIEREEGWPRRFSSRSKLIEDAEGREGKKKRASEEAAPAAMKVLVRLDER